MGIFDGANEAPIGGNRLYFQPGNYTVQIDTLKSISAQQSFKGEAAFVAECIVVQSDVPTLPRGSVASWVQKIKNRDDHKRIAFASIKQFFAALYGDLDGTGLEQALQSYAHTFETHCDFACSEGNPYRGQSLDLVAYVKNLKEGGVFTIHDWKPLGFHNWQGAQ